MATIIYKLSGGTNQTTQAATLGELKEKLNLKNHVATIKFGAETLSPTNSDYQLQDGMLLVFTEQVKGA